MNTEKRHWVSREKKREPRMSVKMQHKLFCLHLAHSFSYVWMYVSVFLLIIWNFITIAISLLSVFSTAMELLLLLPFLLLFVTTRGLEMSGKFMFSICCAAFVSIFSLSLFSFLLVAAAAVFFDHLSCELAAFWIWNFCAIRRICINGRKFNWKSWDDIAILHGMK